MAGLATCISYSAPAIVYYMHIADGPVMGHEVYNQHLLKKTKV